MAGAMPVTDNSGSLTVDAAAASFANNQAQVSGTAVSVNSGAKDAGTQRVILASDQTVVPVSDNAGSLTVDAPVGPPCSRGSPTARRVDDLERQARGGRFRCRRADHRQLGQPDGR
jgi:hypothetical protein